MFSNESLLCSQSLHLSNEKYSKTSSIVIYYYNFKHVVFFKYNIKCNLLLWIFSIMTPVFSFTWYIYINNAEQTSLRKDGRFQVVPCRISPMDSWRATQAWNNTTMDLLTYDKPWRVENSTWNTKNSLW